MEKGFLIKKLLALIFQVKLFISWQRMVLELQSILEVNSSDNNENLNEGVS